MDKRPNWLRISLRAGSYVLVAAAASAITFFLCLGPAGVGQSKLDQLEALLLTYFVDGADATVLEDSAATAMVDALGDRWSYYVPAAEYAAFIQQRTNAYVGVGITIAPREDDLGFDILQVEAGGSAKEAGILPGDILAEVEGQSVAELGISGTGGLVSGQEGTTVNVAVLRNGEKLPMTLTRKKIQVTVAKGELLDGNVGLVTIKNFNDRCADEAIAAIEALRQQGAEYLIFDVRNNPGGYKTELVDLLNYLLPEGPLFRSRDYAGRETVDQSDAACLEMPMAVLVNGESYSAAEFFAAALEEYDWAIVAGDPTSGKGHYQNTYVLSDGSAVGLSVGRYTTPNDVDLEGVGITPQVLVEVDDQTAALIYAEALDHGEDPQLQAAIRALREVN